MRGRDCSAGRKGHRIHTRLDGRETDDKNEGGSSEPKTLRTARQYSCLVESKHVKRPQQSPEAHHQQRRQPSNEAAAVDATGLFGIIRHAADGIRGSNSTSTGIGIGIGLSIGISGDVPGTKATA